MNPKLKRIQSDCDYEGKWPYPPDYGKTAMYNDLRYLLKEVERLQSENEFLLERNLKLSENLQRFGYEPEPYFARPGSEDEAEILNRES